MYIYLYILHSSTFPDEVEGIRSQIPSTSSENAKQELEVPMYRYLYNWGGGGKVRVSCYNYVS